MDDGCSITLTETRSGTPIQLPDDMYGIWKLQVHQTGSFRWQANDPGCIVTPLVGSGTAKLPFTHDQSGDTDAFAAPRRVAVHIIDFRGNQGCELRLYDPTDGVQIDVATAKSGTDTVTLDTGGRRQVFLSNWYCVARVSAGA
jgi:hypothetical protein